MITAITAKDKNTTAHLDERFGRCPYFAIYDHNTGNTEFIENPYRDDQGGVGTRVVELLANKEVTQVVATEFGPKAQALLEQLKIQMIVPADQSQTVEHIINNMN